MELKKPLKQWKVSAAFSLSTGIESAWRQRQYQIKGSLRESGAEVRKGKESRETRDSSTPFCTAFLPYFIILSSIQLWDISRGRSLRLLSDL